MHDFPHCILVKCPKFGARGCSKRLVSFWFGSVIHSFTGFALQSLNFFTGPATYYILCEWKHFIMLLVNFWVFVLYRYIQTLRQTLISNLKGNLPSFDIFSSILIKIFKLVNCLLMQPCPRFPVFIWLCRTPCCFCGHSVPCYTWSFWWGWWHSGVALIEPKNIILAT